MKKQIALIPFIILFCSCASVKVKELTSLSPKPADCKLDVFMNASEVGRKYEELCQLNSRTARSLYVKRTGEAAVNKARPKACQCGADAIIVLSSGRGKISVFSWLKPGVASVLAIKYK